MRKDQAVGRRKEEERKKTVQRVSSSYCRNWEVTEGF